MWVHLLMKKALLGCDLGIVWFFTKTTLQITDLKHFQRTPVFIQPTLKCFQSTGNHSQQSAELNQHTGNLIQPVLE
jgi:hypothetical protein